jgi:hypothetical protein
MLTDETSRIGYSWKARKQQPRVATSRGSRSASATSGGRAARVVCVGLTDGRLPFLFAVNTRGGSTRPEASANERER